MVDITPLRTSRSYRWLYTGQIGIQFARQSLLFAVQFQAYELTGSSFKVGLVGLVQIVPLAFFSLVGGAMADAFDRRRILIGVSALGCLSSIGLALNTGPRAAFWPILVLAAVNAGLLGIESPTRSAIIPTLVPRGQLASAFALNQTLTQTASALGPAAAGFLTRGLGVSAAYWFSLFSGLVAVLAMIPLGSQPPAQSGTRIGLAATVDAFRYWRSQPLLKQVLLIDLNAMVFGMPRALFPAIGTGVLGGDAATVGLLNGAPGVGALIAAATSGWVSAVKRQGRVVILAVVAWGVAIIAFGLTRNLNVALVMLALAGAGDVGSNVFRSTILQLAVPDDMRGRLTSFKVLISGTGPLIGDAEAGAVADVTSPTFSVISGGAASILGAALIAWRGKALWNQRSDETDASDLEPNPPIPNGGDETVSPDLAPNAPIPDGGTASRPADG